MARPKNPNNTYDLTCRVTNKAVKTNPKQVAALVKRYGITDEQLKTTYVSREGRAQIAAEKLTPEQAVEKYGILSEVANALKATVKPKPAKVEKPVVETPTETPVTPETSTVVEETPVVVEETPVVVEETPVVVEE